MNDLYQKLVDLYAGDELPTELKDELESAAQNDPALKHDMQSLKTTVDALRSLPEPAFGEESFQRILLRMYTKGADIDVRQPANDIWQLNLPLSG